MSADIERLVMLARLNPHDSQARVEAEKAARREGVAVDLRRWCDLGPVTTLANALGAISMLREFVFRQLERVGFAVREWEKNPRGEASLMWVDGAQEGDRYTVEAELGTFRCVQDGGNFKVKLFCAAHEVLSGGYFSVIRFESVDARAFSVEDEPIMEVMMRQLSREATERWNGGLPREAKSEEHSAGLAKPRDLTKARCAQTIKGKAMSWWSSAARRMEGSRLNCFPYPPSPLCP